MSHIEIHDIAVKELQMEVLDFFVLTQKSNPVIQHKHQQHARKDHSYLWVFARVSKRLASRVISTMFALAFQTALHLAITLVIFEQTHYQIGD
jgi:hypothetical protein